MRCRRRRSTSTDGRRRRPSTSSTARSAPREPEARRPAAAATTAASSGGETREWRLLGGGNGSRHGPGRNPRRRRWRSAHAHLLFGDAQHARRDARVALPLGRRAVRARRGLGRRRPISRRPRDGHPLPDARGRRRSRARSSGRGHGPGVCGVASRDGRTRCRWCVPTARRRRSRRRRPIAFLPAPSFSSRLPAAVATGRPRSRDPELIEADIRDGYVTDGGARADYPHAF